MKNHTTAALRVEPFHILKTNEYCTPILEIAPLKTIQPDTFPSRARSRPAYGPFSPSGKARLAALGKCAVYHSSDHLPIHFLYIL